MMDNTMAEFVKTVIKTAGYSIPQYCALAGMSKQAFYTKLRNNSFNTRDFQKMEQILGVRLVMGAFYQNGTYIAENRPLMPAFDETQRL